MTEDQLILTLWSGIGASAGYWIMQAAEKRWGAQGAMLALAAIAAGGTVLILIGM